MATATPATASERAAEAVVRIGREIDSATRAIATLRDATDEPRDFVVSKDAITRDLERVEKALVAMRARRQDVPAELLPRLSHAEVALGVARGELFALGEPKRWRNVVGEDNLLAILAKPLVGSAGSGWEVKERELTAALGLLSPADCRVLSERVRKAKPDDPIVAAFARMVPQRRMRLLAFLDDARRREAIAAPASRARPAADSSVESEPKLKRTAFGNYVRINVTDLSNAIVGHLKSVAWPDPARDVTFANGGELAFVLELSAAFLPHLERAESLPQLLYPSDIIEAFDQAVPDPKHAAWNPTFGLAMAQAVEATAKSSLHRLAPRYHHALVQLRHPPGADDLTSSHPIDPLVAAAMVAPNVIAAKLDENAAVSSSPEPVRESARVERWLGRQHPELWNFVQVSPANATVEEVAATLWADPKKSTMAIALRKYDDVFRVEPAYARKLIAARYHGEVVGSANVDNETQIMALARSALRTGDAPTREVSDHQAAPSAQQLADIEHDIGVRLDAIRQAAASVGMSSDLATAYGARAARLAFTAGAEDATRARWLPVLQFQHTQLISLTPTIVTLANQLAAFEASSPAARGPLAATLLLYVRAAAVSHLRDESTALARTARERELRTSRRALDEAQRDVVGATVDVASVTGTIDAHATDAARQNAAARATVLDGHVPHDQDEVLTLAGEVSLRSRMRATEHSLSQLYAAATDAFGDPHMFRRLFPNVKTYPEVIADVRAHLADVHQVWTAATRAGTPQGPSDPNGPADRAQWQGRSAGLTAARARFAQIAGDESITEFLREAREKIEHQQFINAIVSVGANLLITVVTGMGAAALGKVIAGQLIAESGGLAAQIMSQAVQGMVAVPINTAVQMALSDGKASLGSTLLENALMELFTRAMSTHIARVERAAAIEGRELAELPHLLEVERAALRAVDFAGAHLMADTVGGFAAQWAAHKVILWGREIQDREPGSASEPDAEPFALTALQQGAAIGIGRFFHGRIAAWTRHRSALARLRIGQLPEMRALFAERDAFHASASAAATNPSPEPTLGEQLVDTEVTLVERETALIKAHPDLMTSSDGGREHRGEPARTPWGSVWPGEVPEHAPVAQKAIFAKAAEVFWGLAHDGYQAGSVGRIRWAEYLGEHGIAVDGPVRFGGAHEIYEHHDEVHEPTPASVALSRDATIGERSANTGHVTHERCLVAADELIARGAELKGAKREANKLWLRGADGALWSIEIGVPRPTRPDEMAALSHGAQGDVVWVSETLTNDQVPRALGAILGEAMAHSGRAEHAGARFGELDAMLAHREEAAAAPRSQLPAKPTAQETRAHANQESRIESVSRIDAELDLLMSRMGLLEPGPRRDEQLARMSPALAKRVLARLDQRSAIRFQPEAMIGDAAVPRSRAAPETSAGRSSVLPEAPEQVRAYNEGDRDVVLELRVELEVLAELDARIAQRDRPGTNNSPDLARGETARREKHLARARELLAKLQLGGDSAYLHARLRELEAVFPGVEADLVPMVTQRAARRDSSAAKHQQMEAFRAERVARQAQLTKELMGQKVISTKRLVVGDGFSGLANVATLGMQKQGEWIAPSELLVFGGPDLVALLATNDPSFRWGQRAATYDRETEAHPAFGDRDGHGSGELGEIVEDPGEFMHVGEVRDAMDQARKRLGIVAVDARVLGVELASDGAPNPPWEADAQAFPVRVKASISGEERFVYVDRADLAPGPGKPRMPNETILSPADRSQLIGKNNGDGVMFSGEKLLEGKTANLRGKRVLVMAFGPTGAWAAVVASRSGAARVDFSGTSGGEVGTRENNPKSHADMSQIDRVQDAIQGNNIHLTMDRIVHIEPAGEGAIVTYAHGPGEKAEVYQVHYDAIINSMGYTTNANAPSMPGEPTVKEMLGNRKMVPQKGTVAPVLQDETGHVRVMGFAAGDATNVHGAKPDGKPEGDAAELLERRKLTSGRTSADSPDDRVVEGVGISTRDSNRGRKP